MYTHDGRVKISSYLISSYLSSISYVATSESCEYIFSYNGSSFDIDTISISWRPINVSDFFANVIFIAREIMKLIIYVSKYLYVYLLPSPCSLVYMHPVGFSTHWSSILVVGGCLCQWTIVIPPIAATCTHQMAVTLTTVYQWRLLDVSLEQQHVGICPVVSGV